MGIVKILINKLKYFKKIIFLKMNIIFFVRHFTERGTEVAIYDYAKYNEIILKNKSYIVCFNEKKTKRN
jgi:hypothetical protein